MQLQLELNQQQLGEVSSEGKTPMCELFYIGALLCNIVVIIFLFAGIVVINVVIVCRSSCIQQHQLRPPLL